MTFAACFVRRWPLVAAAALTFSTHSIAAVAATSPTELIRKGNSAYEANRFDDALWFFDNALDALPLKSDERNDAIYRKAVTLFALKKPAQARKVLDELIAEAPNLKSMPGVIELRKLIDEATRPPATRPTKAPPTNQPVAKAAAAAVPQSREQRIAIATFRATIADAVKAAERGDREANQKLLKEAEAFIPIFYDDLTMRDVSVGVSAAWVLNELQTRRYQETWVYELIASIRPDWDTDDQLLPVMVNLKRKIDPSQIARCDSTATDRHEQIKTAMTVLSFLPNVDGLGGSERKQLDRIFRTPAWRFAEADDGRFRALLLESISTQEINTMSLANAIRRAKHAIDLDRRTAADWIAAANAQASTLEGEQSFLFYTSLGETLTKLGDLEAAARCIAKCGVWRSGLETSIAMAIADQGKIAEAKDRAGRLNVFDKVVAFRYFALSQARNKDIKGAKLTAMEFVERLDQRSGAFCDILIEQADHADMKGAQETFKSVTEGSDRVKASKYIGRLDFLEKLGTARSSWGVMHSMITKAAIEDAEKEPDELGRLMCLNAICDSQARGGEIDSALKTVDRMLRYSRDRSFNRLTQDAWSTCAVAASRYQNPASALKIVDAHIPADRRSSVYSRISRVLAKKGDYENAAVVAGLIKRDSGFHERDSAYAELARSKAFAGDITGANAALNMVSFRNLKISACLDVADAYAKRKGRLYAGEWAENLPDDDAKAFAFLGIASSIAPAPKKKVDEYFLVED